MEGNTKSAILVLTCVGWHTNTYTGVSGNHPTMNQLTIILSLIAITSVKSQSLIPEYRLKNERLLAVVGQFSDSIEQIYKGRVVTSIHFDQLLFKTVYPPTQKQVGSIIAESINLSKGEDTIDLTFEIFPCDELYYRTHPPAAYFFLDDRPFLIYSGLEDLMMRPKASTIRHLERKLRKYKVSRVVTGVPLWGLHLTNENLEILYWLPATKNVLKDESR